MKDNAIQMVDNIEDGHIGDFKIVPIRGTDGKIISGLTIGKTLEQNKAVILMVNPGEVKQYPTLGVGLNDATLSDDLLDLRHKIRQEFSKDGLKIVELDLYKNKNIVIKAKY